MKIATWNVNSLNVRLPHVLEWLEAHKPDALCLQETKQEDIKFPYEVLKEAGYNAIHSGQKTYNGVAIISPHGIDDVQMGIPTFADEQKRLIAATINGIRIVCVYIPNGQAVGSEKYAYKLSWLRAFTPWLKDEISKHSKLALLGDYNIAPEDIDCHDPASWVGQVLVSEPERDAFKALTNLGLTDSFRLFEKDGGQFSWWDYRMAGFRRNLGMRIDHILVTPELSKACSTSYIDKTPRKLERPSDHTPVVLEFNN